MTRRGLLRAWLSLTALTALGTGLHFSGLPPRVAGGLILAIAGLKARLVLLDYLELRGVAGWAAGLQFIMAALITLLTVLFVAA
ncbi:MAG: cytochrome C oxidase subunit IV family protein [Pseudomonadota bacterium]